MKNWKDFNDECPNCGDIAEVYTSAKGEYVYDGDLAQCKGCGLEGAINVSDEDDDGFCGARVDWNDYDDEL